MYLKDILCKYSDEEHPLSANQIAEMLREYGIEAERKSIYNDMEMLAEYGLDIMKLNGRDGGFFIGSREFELAELKLLIDAVQSSRFITKRKSEQLVKKISSYASEYDAESLKGVLYSINRIKGQNESILYTVDIINTAIRNNRQILFKYCECGYVFCSSCYSCHKDKTHHKQSIDSDKYFLYCKKKGHFDETFKGYCYDCNENYCKLCEKEHIKHSKILINTMEVEQKEIDKIKKLNQDYRSLITYYESLIKLNNLIIQSYEKNRDNYYNLFNMHSIISNASRNPLTKNDNFYQSISPGEGNTNIINYISNLYGQELNEDETVDIKINHKNFNNFDFKILSQMPLYNLKILELDNNSITKIDCLENAEYPELIVLSLKNNAIVDISVLARVKFEELQGILLSNNNISDINSLERANFKKLRLIDLRNNNIDNISVFEYIENERINALQCVYLTGNKYDTTKIDKVKNLLGKCEELLL